MTTTTQARAPRVLHVEARDGFYYPTDQFGGFNLRCTTEIGAESYIDQQVGLYGDTRRPYGRWITEPARDTRTRTAHAVVERLADGTERRVRLSVTHLPSHKAFAVTLTRLTATPAGNGSAFPTESYQPMRDIQRLALDRVARFSAKALQGEWEAAVRRADLDLAGPLAWMLAADDDTED